MLFTAETEAELQPVAKYLIQQAEQNPVITFKGDLGAGKTTLIKEVCKQLGVQENVSSPTFGLVNVYTDSKGEEVYHFDCYRMKDISEAYDIGFEEYLDSGNICLIEWPEIIEPLLTTNTISVQISISTDQLREIEVSHT
jgi:tRNA threonylcarbamoyladenosine biosynthesis protein TsaE